VVARIGALGVLQLSVLALIFLIVNSSAEFYSSWSDLLGDQSGGGAIVAGQAGTSENAASSRALAPVTVLGASAVAVPDRPKEAGGQLQRVRLYGQLSGISTAGYVYLPPGYGTRGETALPVTVVISGDLGSPSNSYGAGALAGAAASQIAAHRLTPMVIVMLPAEVGQHDQGCLNVPGSTQAALFFTQDLPQVIGSAYRATPPATRRWSVVGDSSGGYCALQLAMTSSQTFAVAAVPPGGYTAPPGPAESGGSPQIRAQDDLSWLVKHQPMQPISVLFTGGGTGQPFVSAARPPTTRPPASCSAPPPASPARSTSCSTACRCTTTDGSPAPGVTAGPATGRLPAHCPAIRNYTWAPASISASGVRAPPRGPP